MSIENFVIKRKKEIEGKVSQSAHDDYLRAMFDAGTYIDCKSCLYYKDAVCLEQGASIPSEIIPLGCGKGELDIPF